MTQQERTPESPAIVEEPRTENKGGAPLGNQNARTHGFYSKVLTEADRRSLAQAVEIAGLDEEIALLRVKIKSIVEHDPDNVELIVRATTTLARLALARAAIAKDEDKDDELKQTLLEVLNKLALPPGLGIGGAIK